MNNLKITMLDINQLFGDNMLKILKRDGRMAVNSDYTILSGEWFGYTSNIYNLQKNRTKCYWTKTCNGYNDAYIILNDGRDDYISGITVSSRNIGVRPVLLPYSSISNICSNKRRTIDGILEVEYGEYPQSAVSKELQNILENLYQNNSLTVTGKIYTRDSRKYDEYDKTFQEEIHQEYEYNGKKYIRVKEKGSHEWEYFTLSNEEQYKVGNEDYIWIEVEPIKWLVEEEKNIAVSKKLLFAGIQFKNTSDYKSDFENTNLYWYLNTYFIKEIIPSQKQKIYRLN